MWQYLSNSSEFLQSCLDCSVPADIPLPKPSAYRPNYVDSSCQTMDFNHKSKTEREFMRKWAKGQVNLDRVDVMSRIRHIEDRLAELDKLIQLQLAELTLRRDHLAELETFVQALDQCADLEDVEDDLLAVKYALDSKEIGPDVFNERIKKLLV